VLARAADADGSWCSAKGCRGHRLRERWECVHLNRCGRWSDGLRGRCGWSLGHREQTEEWMRKWSM